MGAAETFPMDGGSKGAPTEEMFERPGDTIGPFKLLSMLGEGGFGVVWAAERREPFVQRVALKVIKPGMDSRAVVARFEQERQALAVMDHPHVARVFDAGVTAQGRPYFVMELVQGEPITEFCDRHDLTVRERLELLIPVCEAVQHAHMKGILHRDLKPSNILVEVVDGKSMPKVIDFGVSKAMSQAFTEKTIFTERGQIMGTPEYMSPEQAEMGATDIDTRADVYSLGVILYEMLTGVLPFDAHSLRSSGFDALRKTIREVEPKTPSQRLSSLGADAVPIAKHRQVPMSGLIRQLRRELEWVPMKAMSKNRANRYRTPVDLADDLRKYLSGAPLSAGPASGPYRMRKALMRRRQFFAGLAVGGALVATPMLLLRPPSLSMLDDKSGETARILGNIGASLGLVLAVELVCSWIVTMLMLRLVSRLLIRWKVPWSQCATTSAVVTITWGVILVAGFLAFIFGYDVPGIVAAAKAMPESVRATAASMQGSSSLDKRISDDLSMVLWIPVVVGFVIEALVIRWCLWLTLARAFLLQLVLAVLRAVIFSALVAVMIAYLLLTRGQTGPQEPSSVPRSAPSTMPS